MECRDSGRGAARWMPPGELFAIDNRLLLQSQFFQSSPDSHVRDAELLNHTSDPTFSASPHGLHFFLYRIVFNERVGNSLEHRPQVLSVILLGLEKGIPWPVRVVFVEELVFFVGDSVTKCNTCHNGSCLIAAKPVRQLISEGAKG